jgi:hypothetical protein
MRSRRSFVFEIDLIIQRHMASPDQSSSQQCGIANPPGHLVQGESLAEGNHCFVDVTAARG